MAIFKEFSQSDIKTSKSFLNQLIDIVGVDVSSSNTRRSYQVFVTGGLGPGVTSSIFQTVYDQNFTLQTANPLLDVTVGLAADSGYVLSQSPTIDSNGKYLFPASTLMMREKMDVYRMFAQDLLGDAEETFTATVGETSVDIKEALFIPFKRLIARDQIKRETFAMRLFTSASDPTGVVNLGTQGQNAVILTDVNSSTNKIFGFSGQVSTLVDSANVTKPKGLVFLDKGVAVVDMRRTFDQENVYISGSIDAVTDASGQVVLSGNFESLCVQGSMDEVLDHICTSRFSGSFDTAITFQNVTNINSTLYFARVASDEFNYSSNPTYVDSNNRIVVIDEGQEETQQSFTFITSVGLYDAYDNLLGVAKLSRPVYNDGERDLTFKIRIDY